MGRIARVRTPWIKDLLIRWFIHHFGVDLSEVPEPDPQGYPHFAAFFTRTLKPGVRPICAQRGGIAAPADGTLSQFGSIRAGEYLIQAKGRDFTLTELLGGIDRVIPPFRGGEFATVYLSPRDYHRVHMPTDGTLRETIHIPGRLFGVNPTTAHHIPRLFARNERVVVLFDTPVGRLAMVLVGAIGVASIELRWAGTITPPRGHRIRCWSYPHSGEGEISLLRGEQMGLFNLGSTVIVLFEPGRFVRDPNLTPGQPFTMGQCLGWAREKGQPTQPVTALRSGPPTPSG